MMTASVPPFPEIIEVELTRSCNLDCKMCQRKVLRSLDPKLRLAERTLRKVLSHCQGWSPQINLGGLGESLLHPELPDLLAIIKQANPRIRTGMNTNGLLLTNEHFNWMTDGRLDYLEISLNAPTREDYQWLCGVDRYMEICERAECFLRRKGLGNLPLTTVHSFAVPRFAISNRSFVKRWSNLADFAQIRELGNWGGVLDTSQFEVTRSPGGVCDRPWHSIAVDLIGNYHRCCASFALWRPTQTIFETPMTLLHNS